MCILVFRRVKEVLDKVTNEKEEQEFLVKRHMETEQKIAKDAKKLALVCTEGELENNKLHMKVDYIASLEASNLAEEGTFKEQLDRTVQGLERQLEQWGGEQAQGYQQVPSAFMNFLFFSSLTIFLCGVDYDTYFNVFIF